MSAPSSPDRDTLRAHIALAVNAAVRAGHEILQVYGTEFTVDIKADNTPLTEADRRSCALIESSLEATSLPVLSEEGKQTPYEERGKWEWLWLVDPLDGTKEFVKFLVCGHDQ